MTSIVPRWEWRGFGGAFADAEERLAPALGAPITSEETYVIRAGSNLNVKIRQAALDVKALRQVSADGLEQWMPVLRAPFPLDAPAVAALFAAWRAAPPLRIRPVYDLATFFRELVDPDRRLSRVQVVKARRTGVYEGCLVEIAELAVEHASTRTLAVESEEPARVLAVLRTLRFSPHDNVNYVRALERFVVARAQRLRSGVEEAPCHDETVAI